MKKSKLPGIILWLVLILICLRYADYISIENIVNYSPANPVLAAVVLLGLFTLKGITMVINGNIFYMASGLMFPLPWALLINLSGTCIMTSIAYCMGRRGGSGLLDSLVKKYPKLEMIKRFPQENEFRLTLLLRLLGLLPCEATGVYLGACELKYPVYMAGTILGLMPAILGYLIMGKYLYVPASPQFIAAAALQVICTAAVLLYLLIKSRPRRKT